MLCDETKVDQQLMRKASCAVEVIPISLERV
jgi:hypothetical protein